MCGIVGFQGPFHAELLQQMTDAVAHRGPDGEGTVMLQVEGQAPTGLGHRRLAIIDLSRAGLQPMTVVADAGGGMRSGLTLVFNGEIYNYRELRAQLVAAGHRFLTETDSEVLLHLYERDGLRMLERLNGIFAFAIHDARGVGRPDGVACGALFLARDQLGVKPLYYAQSAAGFLFGSEIKALICDPQLSRQIDPIALHQLLAYLWTPAPRTMLAAVRKLEPGAAMIIDQGQIRRHWLYYTLPYDGSRDARPAAQIAQELGERVADAVRRQLVADVPVGAFLSGGLDSSAIVAMMRREWPDRRITCFSIRIAQGMDSEGNPADLPYARRVARHLAVDLQEVLVEPSSIERLEEMVNLLDEPQADPAPINALLIAERARAMGIPVLLSGAGGDDIFSGYRRHWLCLSSDAGHGYRRRCAAACRGSPQRASAAAVGGSQMLACGARPRCSPTPGRARNVDWCRIFGGAPSRCAVRYTPRILRSRLCTQIPGLRCSRVCVSFPMSVIRCSACSTWNRGTFSRITISTIRIAPGWRWVLKCACRCWIWTS